MHNSKRTFLASLSAAGLASALPVWAQQNLLRVVVPLTPGTTPDTLARALSPILQERLQMGVVVENKAGASSMIGMSAVAKATDATTLMVIPATTVTLPQFYKKVDFDVLKAFTPITQLVSSSFVLVVGNGVPATNLNEFVTWAKANPGEFYASPGAGTHHHLFMEMLLQSMQIKLSHVAYKGSAPALNDVLAGQVPTMFLPIQVAVPLRESGRLKIIGGSLRERHPNFPDIPSLQEQGAKNYHADPWFAIWGGPATPASQVARYRTAIIAGLNTAEIKENFASQGLIIKTSTPAELQQMTKNESDMWIRVIQSAQIKPE